MLLKTIKEKYQLSWAHVASLLSKTETEKTLKEDLEGNTGLSIALNEILMKPENLLKILETGKERISALVYNRAKNKAHKEIVLKLG